MRCCVSTHTHGALGGGSAAKGGAPSTTDGGTFAFGNTEEALRAKVFGLTARGEQAQGPHDRRTGTGWVAERQGDYSDALAKGHNVALMGCESTGAIYPAFSALLRVLGKAAAAPGTQDSTVYGTSRASPSSYYAHHVAAISAAVTRADAVVILNAAATMSFKLSVGMPALS